MTKKISRTTRITERKKNRQRLFVWFESILIRVRQPVSFCLH